MQNVVRQGQTIPLALQGAAVNSFPITATGASGAAGVGGVAGNAGRYILSSVLADQVQGSQQDVAMGCLSAPSLSR